MAFLLSGCQAPGPMLPSASTAGVNAYDAVVFMARPSIANGSATTPAVAQTSGPAEFIVDSRTGIAAPANETTLLKLKVGGTLSRQAKVESATATASDNVNVAKTSLGSTAGGARIAGTAETIAVGTTQAAGRMALTRGESDAIGISTRHGGMTVASASFALARADDNGRMAQTSARAEVTAVALSQALGVQASLDRLHTAEASSAMLVARDRDTVHQTEVQQRMAAAAASDTLSSVAVAQHETVAAGGDTMQQQTRQAALGVRTGGSQVHQTGRVQTQRVVHGRGEIGETVQMTAIEVLGNGRTAIPLVLEAGDFSVFRELADLTGLSDEAIIQGLRDSGELCGLIGENGQLLVLADEGLVQALAEATMQQSLFNHPLLLRCMKERGMLAHCRLQGTDDSADKLHVSMEYVGKQRQSDAPFAPGDSVNILLTVKNASGTSVDDVIFFLPVPEHAVFNGFLEPKERKGYMRFYFNEQRVLAWKITVPLQPKQGLNALFRIRLDKWTLQIP